MTLAAIDTSCFQRHLAIDAGDEEETALLLSMAERAHTYLQGFRWCPPIRETFLAFGVGDLIALFLVRFERPVEGWQEDQVWVIVGDLPPAYLDTEEVRDSANALEIYCVLMDDWADRIIEGRDLDDAFPIEAAPTVEHAKLLKIRTEAIGEKCVPRARAGDVIAMDI